MPREPALLLATVVAALAVSLALPSSVASASAIDPGRSYVGDSAG